jgi:hypothetical protein
MFLNVHFFNSVNSEDAFIYIHKLFMFREKPNMALVLWEPPAGSINPLLSGGRRVQTEEDNNNTSAVDLNSISTSGYAFV